MNWRYELMREVDQASFAAAPRDSAVVIDVREPYEYVTGHVPGARLVPMGQLAGAIGKLPRTGRIYVICATGNRSLAAADLLAANGLDAWSVAGGTLAWLRNGNPLVQGMHASAA
jgi:rhodanese-related sulfurtransferase